MSSINDLSVAQLKQAIEIREQIELLQNQLASLGTRRLGRPPLISRGLVPAPSIKRRGMSAAGRAAIAAAAKARWAQYRAETADTKPAKTGRRRKFNSAARARLSAAAKARWAKAKAAGKNAL